MRKHRLCSDFVGVGNVMIVSLSGFVMFFGVVYACCEGGFLGFSLNGFLMVWVVLLCLLGFLGAS